MDNFLYLKELVKYLKGRGIGLLGCTQEEIELLEEHHGIKLPKAYHEYLLAMGKYSGPINVGSYAFYDDLFDLNEGAKELMEEYGSRDTLPDDAFVFLNHQSYVFLFFNLTEGENPPTYGYSQSKNLITKDFDSFSDYLEAAFSHLDRILGIKPHS